MSDNGYRSRIIDGILEDKLGYIGAIIVIGTKWCGKTTSCMHVSGSHILIDDNESSQQNRLLASLDVKRIIAGETPRLIDEWQLIPWIWDAIRHEVDERKRTGQFILTGSSTPMETDEIHHSGTGRYSWVVMRPMSLYESGESNGSVSLKGLFDGISLDSESDMDLQGIAYATCRGGWPAMVCLETDKSLEGAFDYVDSILRIGVKNSKNVNTAKSRMRSVLRSYARNQGTETSFREMAKDIPSGELTSNEAIVSEIVGSLSNMFVVEDLQAWNPNLRSKTAVRSSPKRYFVDPSVATAVLGLGPDDLINDLNTFGQIFETLCIRDLRIYAEPMHGEIFHYRDKNGLECDAVVHIRGGKYGLIEIKLGDPEFIDVAAKHLIALKNKIDTTKMNEASFCAVVTAVGRFAYTRDDGVHVIPIGCLKD